MEVATGTKKMMMADEAEWMCLFFSKSGLSFGQIIVPSSVDMPRLGHSTVNRESFRLLLKVMLLLRLRMPFWLLIMTRGRRQWWGWW